MRMHAGYNLHSCLGAGLHISLPPTPVLSSHEVPILIWKYVIAYTSVSFKAERTRILAI